MIKPENLSIAIEVIKGAARALDLLSGDLAELEQTELFQALTPHNIALIASDVSDYAEALRNVKTLADKNGGELPTDDPSIKKRLIDEGMIGQGYGDAPAIKKQSDMVQVDNDYSDGDGDFRSALNGALGFNFL